MTDMQRVLMLERLKGEIRWGSATFAGAVGRLGVLDHSMSAHFSEREKAILAEGESLSRRIDTLINDEIVRRD